MSVVIIGGGVIGLSVGWGLQRAGLSVTLIDSSHPTSYHAAGMLAPYTESLPMYPQWLKLAEHSLKLYPPFLDALAEESGIRVPLIQSGTLLTAVDSDDAEWLNRIFQSAKRHATFITTQEARSLEPFLSPRIVSALWLAEEAHLDTHLLLEALKRGFISQGGTLLLDTVHSLIETDNKVTGIKTAHQTYSAEHVIVCAGSYSGPPVRPLKGEMVILKSTRPLKYMIRSPRVYLVPKPDNQIYVGATSVETGFDWTFSAQAMRILLQDAWEIMPAIDEMAIVSSGVGLRPTAVTPLPLINKVGEGLYFATGHGRAGILLAPYTQEKIVKLIVNGEEQETDAEMLSELFEPKPGHAAAVNNVVIPQKKWSAHRLSEGDHIEIVIPFQGG